MRFAIARVGCACNSSKSHKGEQSMCKELKVKQLPNGTKLRDEFIGDYYGKNYDRSVYDEVVINDFDYASRETANLQYMTKTLVKAKLRMLWYVRDVLKKENVEFDCFNGLAPTRVNLYRAYEFTSVWLWTEIAYFIENSDTGGIPNAWYNKYKGVLASVMRKYPKITGMLISIADLKLPGNKLLDYSKIEDADFDNDHTDEVLVDDKAEEFKAWILRWCDMATEKDKMRVRRWFDTQKSHKQIFAEINKVGGNPMKFNARLALFVERLFNQKGLEYFFEKTGFDSKEELFMAYFDKLTRFDDDTKKSFIKKYLLGN